MKKFFTEKGIIHWTSCPHTPKQNGVAETKNRILLEMTRVLLIESKVSNGFWLETIGTATYLLNWLPNKILNMKTPKILSPLCLSSHVFGCSVFVHIPKIDRTKSDMCVVKCVWATVSTKNDIIAMTPKPGACLLLWTTTSLKQSTIITNPVLRRRVLQ